MRPSPKVLSGDVAERYAVEGEIGRGGTAVVYRAHDRVRGIDVAMKLMREDTMGSLSIERFLLEIRQTAKLPHPHIVPVLDSGEFEGRPYFVLPFMDGGTLRDRLRKEKQLPYDEVITLGVTIARALEFAHAHGVIHRDVKPENILYNNGQPCLADFGTARAMERAVNDPTTSTGVVRGTAAYMSPEQASGEREYDGRTDIYSLACVLYEAIAGIQPFVGPSAQAVISQRLTHSPRPVSVYRPSVPPAVEQVLVRATAMVPADRYQRAGELAEALEESAKALIRSRSTPTEVRSRITRSRRALVGGVVLGAAVLIVAIAAKNGIHLPSISKLPTVDTTLVAIMPVETEGTLHQIPGQELFAEGLRGWSGVSAVETFATTDAIRRRRIKGLSAAAAQLSIDEMAKIVSDLGAGRFIRSRLTSGSGLRTIYATLYDVRNKRDLHHAALALPADTSRWPAAFASLTDSLMLRGRRDVRGAPAEGSTRNLPSYQAFLTGRSALAEWNLSAADSLFDQAVRFDSSDAASRLWLAQVRSWRNRQPVAWAANAQWAASHSRGLTPAEVRQATALSALGRGSFDAACAAYLRMTKESPRDFIGWYGLGECHRLDRVVVRDTTSPSIWRFRRSYWQGIRAYSEAFKLLPSASRGVQSRAYEPLRQFLYTGPQLRRGGVQGGPEDAFMARPAFHQDTLVFIPYSREAVAKGARLADPAAQAQAIALSRSLFRDIVTSWSLAFPESPSIKEAVGIALEMLGDPAAADSFARARSLTRDPRQRIALVVEEATVRYKFALAGDYATIPRARVLADSVLAMNRVAPAGTAELLARLATLTGRCADAARYGRYADPAVLTASAIGPQVHQQAREAIAMASAGCRNHPMPDLFRSLRAAGLNDSTARQAEYDLVGGVAAIRFPLAADMIRRLAATGDYVLEIETLLLDGKLLAARQALMPIVERRLSSTGADATIDATLTESRLAAALGDTAIAVRLAEKSLAGLRYSAPMSDEQFMTNQFRLGAYAGLVELLATIDQRSVARRRWISMLEELWRGADPELQTRLAELRKNR